MISVVASGDLRGPESTSGSPFGLGLRSIHDHKGKKMTHTGELTTRLPVPFRRRKFTPETIEQIRNLVERGKRREEIAELIGVTVGSLQVTCSRLGISLRRVVFGTRTAPHQDRARTNEVDRVNLALKMQYMGAERTTELPLTQDMIRQLAFEAQFRGMEIGELVGEVIVAIMTKGLFQRVLDEATIDACCAK